MEGGATASSYNMAQPEHRQKVGERGDSGDAGMQDHSFWLQPVPGSQ